MAVRIRKRVLYARLCSQSRQVSDLARQTYMPTSKDPQPTHVDVA